MADARPYDETQSERLARKSKEFPVFPIGEQFYVFLTIVQIIIIIFF